tara:strand:+ start:3774 stop:7607 length:3834 start_codon:yes stop_codon:yes gene_type:complete
MTEQVDILDLLKSKEGGSGSYVPPINIDETTTQPDETNILEILQSKEVEYVNPEPIVESQPVSKRVLEPMVIPKNATDDEALAMQLVPTEERQAELTIEEQIDLGLIPSADDTPAPPPKESELTRVEKHTQLFDQIFETDNDIENMSDEEFKKEYNDTKANVKKEYDEVLAGLGTEIATEMRKGFNSGYQAYGALDIWIANKVDGDADATRFLMSVGQLFGYATSGTVDGIEEGLKKLNDQGDGAMPKLGRFIYKGINLAMSDMRKGTARNEEELADIIAGNMGAFFEFAETIPALGRVVSAVRVSSYMKPKRVAASLSKKYKKEQKKLKKAELMSPDRAGMATREATADKKNLAAQIAAENADMMENLILQTERKLSDRAGEEVSVSKVVDGVLVIDPKKAREVGRKTNQKIADAERTTRGQKITGSADVTLSEFADLATGGDEITIPILNPEKLDGIVAIASDYKRKFKNDWDENDTVIDNLFRLTVAGEIDGQDLIDDLDKYGLSFEDYVLSVVGSGSDAGRVLERLSRIKRVRPMSEKDDAIVKAMAEAQGDFRKFVVRLEGIRRGLLVSQIATAARNLESAVVRSPLESLANVFDTALWNVSNKGYGAGALSLISPQNWKDSFNVHKYMFNGRPDQVKGFVDLILDRPEFDQQFSRMFDNLNEIQTAQGRGTGTITDKLLSEAEDVTQALNIPNRWQEFLVRRATFLGELERLVRREYDLDLFDALQQGKLRSLMNDASDVKPENARSFIDLIDESVTKSLDVTYAKTPDVPLFRNISSFITRNGLTVAIPFPRFMFNSMELMGQYAGGSIPVITRKVMSLVDQKYRGPLTTKDRQRISRNAVGVLGGGGTGLAVLGALTEDEEDPDSIQQTMSDALMSMATVGAAYQYRSGFAGDVPASFNEIYTGTDEKGNRVVLDIKPQFPLSQYMYLGEATRQIEKGTFGDFFDAREFIETFTGSNFRRGSGHVILDEVANIIDGSSDVMAGENLGRVAGRALGEYLGTWMVPFGQAIESQRAYGSRSLDYLDHRPDPSLGGFETFLKTTKRYAIDNRGLNKAPDYFTYSSEKESDSPSRVDIFDPESQRVRPMQRLLFGLGQRTADAEYAEYLKEMGFDSYDLASKSKVPSVENFENEILLEQLPMIVQAAKEYERSIRINYQEGLLPDGTPIENVEVYRRKVSEDKFSNNYVKEFVKAQVGEVKRLLKDTGYAKTTPYVKAVMDFRQLPSGFQKIAVQEYIARFGEYPEITGEDEDESTMVLETLTQIGQAFRETY